DLAERIDPEALRELTEAIDRDVKARERRARSLVPRNQRERCSILALRRSAVTDLPLVDFARPGPKIRAHVRIRRDVDEPHQERDVDRPILVRLRECDARAQDRRNETVAFDVERTERPRRKMAQDGFGIRSLADLVKERERLDHLALSRDRILLQQVEAAK